MSFSLRNLIEYWQDFAALDDDVSAKEMKERMGKLYASLSYYGGIVPEMEVPPPADA